MKVFAIPRARLEAATEAETADVVCLYSACVMIGWFIDSGSRMLYRTSAEGNQLLSWQWSSR